MDESNYLAYHYYLAFDSMINGVLVDLGVHSMLHLEVQGDLGRLLGVQEDLGVG